MTTSCALRLYKAMILPPIDYPNFCLTPSTEKVKTKIQRLQNKALRICFRSSRLDRTSDIHAHAKLSTLDKHREVNILKLIHWKVYTPFNSDQNPSIITIVNNNETVSVSTRLRRAPVIRRDTPTSGKASKSLLYFGAKLWNDLRNEPDPLAFKIAIKRLLYPNPNQHPT